MTTPMKPSVILIAFAVVFAFYYWKSPGDCKTSPPEVRTVRIMGDDKAYTVTTTYSDARIKNGKCLATATARMENAELKEPLIQTRTVRKERKGWVVEDNIGVKPSPDRH